MKKLMIIILSALMVVSCAKKNPLIRTDVIQYLKNPSDTWDENFALGDCAAFYAGYTSKLSDDHKATCDRWAERQFSNVTISQRITDATMQDMTDPKLWQQVFPKEEYAKYLKYKQNKDKK